MYWYNASLDYCNSILKQLLFHIVLCLIFQPFIIQLIADYSCKSILWTSECLRKYGRQRLVTKVRCYLDDVLQKGVKCAATKTRLL